MTKEQARAEFARLAVAGNLDPKTTVQPDGIALILAAELPDGLQKLQAFVAACVAHEASKRATVNGYGAAIQAPPGVSGAYGKIQVTPDGLAGLRDVLAFFETYFANPANVVAVNAAVAKRIAEAAAK